MAAAKKKDKNDNTICRNRRATYDYEIEETLDVGMILVGTEIKSLRAGQASIAEAHAGDKDGALFLINATIEPYGPASQFNHEPKRFRKLLLHKREHERLKSAMARKGYSLIPLAMYFNNKGIAKLKLGLAKGKKKADKREAEKQKEWRREKIDLSRDT